MDMDIDVEKLRAEGKKVPAGFYFDPFDCDLITYLLRKIKGLPPGPDMVKIRDGVHLLDPEQHCFDEFTYCYNNLAFYITNKAERKTEGGGGSKTRVIIKTTTGYWREKKEGFTITDSSWREKKKDTSDEQILGYKKTLAFFNCKNEKTSWRMDELTLNPETVPADVRDQTEKIVLCRIRVKRPKTPEEQYEEFEDEEE